MRHALSLAALLAVAAPMSVAWAAAPDTTSTDTLRRVVPLPEVVVSTSRANAHAPQALTIVSRDELRERNWGQDTPMALATLPGAYAYSDAGNGIGYSYLSIRGFPQRRISVLVNGVPLNDPESHEVYWIDHPDLLASTAELQVQRGVGSALYGAASLGGSVNLETAPFSAAPHMGAALAYGSYDTKRAMLEGSSGPLAGGWDLYARYSRIESAGYRDRSDTELWSYAFSARKRSGAHSFRLNLYGGPEETHLAYLGVPRSVLDGGLTGDADRDRRFNPITYDGERDHFFEPHYEAVHSWAISPRVTATGTWFYYDGKGYYDEQRFGQNLADYRLQPWATSDTLLVPRAYYRDTDGDGNLDRDGSGRAIVERGDVTRRRWVKNQHYGWVPRIRFEHPDGALTIGGELRAHDGHHVGTVFGGNALPPGTEADHVYYDYHPRTLAAGMFLREEWWRGGPLRATADLAWRHQSYAMRGDRFDGVRFDQPYDFALPRLGLEWSRSLAWQLWGSVALSRREPAFRDLFDAEGAGSVPLFVNGSPLIRPERVNDYEVGARWRSRPVDASVGLFRMDFRDELVYAGQFNTDLGYSILGNAARSVHQGVELEAVSRFGAADEGAAHERGRALRIAANATLGDNHFVRYREQYGPTPADEVSYDGNAIGFFPAMLGNLSARVGMRGVQLGVEAQYVGRIYLDNTESADKSIGDHTVLNLSGGYHFTPPGVTHAALTVRLFNALDRRYETGGYVDFDALGNPFPAFIPAARRNVLAELRVEFD